MNGDWVKLGEGSFDLPDDHPLKSLFKGGPMTTQPAKYALLRCTHCGMARQPAVVERLGVAYVEQPGSPHTACNGTWGPPDEADNRLSDLLAKERDRADIRSVTSFLGYLNEQLEESGITDSHQRTIMMMQVILGNIQPGQFGGWKQ